ncbi:MAG: sodium:proton antiporter [Glaciihabitans sp.]|nr:sodium:proton antiporter [Glaciihabitans sp.]
MPLDEPTRKADAVPDDGRDESQTERLDRNWNELIQELRVTQTGTQILTGFLLTVAFQQRFADLDQFQLDVYLVLVALAVACTGLGLAPVSLHRALFRRRAKEQIVAVADQLMRLTLAGVALVLSGTVLLIFDVVAGRTAGLIAGGAALLVTGVLWILLPLVVRPRGKGHLPATTGQGDRAA